MVKEQSSTEDTVVDIQKVWTDLQQKFENEESITGVVTGIVKGGLTVDVGIRGFIPASQVEHHFVKDFSDYKGRELDLKIIEMNPERHRVVLSRKALLPVSSDAKNKCVDDILSSLTVGEQIEGTVRRLADFGAFVDIGGIDGLVHVSELAWYRVDHPSDILSEGDKVSVKILKIDPQNKRVGLSLKDAQKSPWDDVSNHIKQGDVVTGCVKRIVPFGVFVEVISGVEGLVHISQVSHKYIEDPREVLKEGQEVQVKVLDIMPSEKRVSLSIKDVEVTLKAADKKVEQKSVISDDEGGFNITLGDVYPELRNFK